MSNAEHYSGSADGADRPRAVIAGAGLGGLTAAVALHQQGWSVAVCERAAELQPVGSGLAVAANGLRALDVVGLGDAVRALAAIQGDAVVRRPDGRVLSRTSGEAIVRRFGEPVVLALRSTLHELLARSLPDDAIRLGTAATGIDPGDDHTPARLLTERGTLEADLVVVADGVDSALRKALFPDHGGPRFSGFTAWRMLVPAPSAPCVTGETWGHGRVFGVTPLVDGRIYAYAADRAATKTADSAHDIGERAELLERFGDWHAPIPELIASADPAAILHHDVYEIAEPLPAYHLGRVAILGDAAHAMTPHLGQGACQAFEDAVTLAAVVSGKPGQSVPTALSRYTELRRPRGADLVRRSHRIGSFTQAASRPGVALRDLAVRAAYRLLPDAVLRSLDPVLAWEPPRITGS
ncbi:FAD-dependent monooxygenase [Actinospica sp.]|jgi:2-polyprenyl-6-methoxyphenol hydroxylase-like FAD-dependent oxidoreductase|uniref:FAD-dependent monooxygenase n=1 Tax=Actinospica sp. TaxID=1872142 RepID=UPI002B6872AF|nr:FAD-dependent monooxygenase [Actinospica sp.]HWG27038.1 FAD-dependent monooxygenase [Actinospica sp.]